MTTWGGYVNNATGNSGRIGHDQSAENLPDGITARLRIPLTFQSTRAVQDSVNTLVGSGDPGFSGSNFPVNHGSSGGTTSLGVYEKIVARQYGSPTTGHWDASFSGIGAFGSSVFTVGADWSVDPIPYQKPRAPKTPNVMRNSDTKHTVTWGVDYDGANGAQPWKGVRIYRKDNLSNFALVATVPWSVTSWVDGTTVANRIYEYHVYSYNDAGQTGVGAGIRKTTPAAPTDVTAVKDNAGIVVEWTNNAYPVDTFDVYHEWDTGKPTVGGEWALGIAAVPQGQKASWRNLAPDTTKTHRYKVRAYNGDAGQSAESAWSATVQLQAAPNAPTLIGPTLPHDASEGTTFRWQYNPVDTTGQTAYELRYRVQGETAWTTLTGTTARSRAISTLLNGRVYEWQTRTKGAHVDWSPWSVLGVFTTSARPTVSITAPGPEVTSNRVTVQWQYFDAEGTPQAQAQVRLVRNYQELSSHAYSDRWSTASSHTFPTALENGGRYSVFVRVQDGSGLWSPETVHSFDVNFPLPETPELDAVWDVHTGTATVNTRYFSGPIAAGHFEVWRAEGVDVLEAARAYETAVASGGDTAGTYAELERIVAMHDVLVGTVPPGGSIVDQIPAAGTTNVYRVFSVSSLGAAVGSALYLLHTEPHGSWVYLNGGPSFGQMVRVKHGARLRVTKARAKVLRRYAGRELPLERVGTARDHQVVVAARLGDGASSVDEIDEMVDMPAPLCYRDPTGRRWFVSMEESDLDHQGIRKDITLRMTKVMYDE